MRVEAENGLDVTVLESVLECGDVLARMALARQISRLAADAETPAVEREQIVPVLLKLATDAEADVRKALVAGVVETATLNQDVIFAIAADVDSIALPFLARTPALNSWHMQAILRVGDDGRQKAIAGRSDLSSEAAAFVVRAGSAAAVTTLLQNKNVKLRRSDLQAIFQRLGQSPDVVDQLLARADLPLEIRIMQARRAAVRMRQMMAERGWMPANDANDLVADAEDNAVLSVLRDASPEDRAEGMQFLSAQNMLTPSLIVRAACMGEMKVLACALANLSGQDQERVLGLIQSRGGVAVRSLLNRTMLPANCHAILLAACDVAAQLREEDVVLDADGFGRRLLEVLMLQFGILAPRDQAKLMDYVGRFADGKVRKIARKLKADMLRAA